MGSQRTGFVLRENLQSNMAETMLQSTSASKWFPEPSLISATCWRAQPPVNSRYVGFKIETLRVLLGHSIQWSFWKENLVLLQMYNQQFQETTSVNSLWLTGKSNLLMQISWSQGHLCSEKYGNSHSNIRMHHNQGLLPDSKVLKSDMSETHIRSVKPWKSNHPIWYTWVNEASCFLPKGGILMLVVVDFQNKIHPNEQWKIPWILAVYNYRGWNPAQLYRDYFISHCKDAY